MAIKDEDLKKNKDALLDEMGSSLANANEFINSAIEETQDGKPENLLSSVLGLAHQIGYITAVFNQYIVFERGLPEGERKIGFVSMLQHSKE
jgi:hypothetical protein